MRYLGDRPKSSHHGRLDRDRYLYESKIAGVGSTGPNRDLFQERLALSGITGTTFEPYQRQNHHRCDAVRGGCVMMCCHCRQDPALHPGLRGCHPSGAWQAGCRGQATALRAQGPLGGQQGRGREAGLVAEAHLGPCPGKTKLDSAGQADSHIRLLLLPGHRELPGRVHQNQVEPLKNII